MNDDAPRGQSMEVPDDHPGMTEIDDTPHAPIPLGYDHGIYAYLSPASGQVTRLTPGAHSAANLSALADKIHYWERTSFSRKGRINWDDAGNWLMHQCHTLGIYDPTRLRGRGVWFDAGRVVVHLGDGLLVDGRPAALTGINSRFIYERAMSISLDGAETAAPLPAREAAKLLEICQQLPWADPDASAALFAGWLVVAPCCGAMKHRPHYFLNGPSGAGKSWILDNIVKPILGPIAIRVTSGTTEPAIRRMLRIDARPVVWDEAETEKRADRERLQAVADYARACYSDEDAQVAKAVQGGAGVEVYEPRAQFFWSAINYGLTQQADQSRTITGTLTQQLHLDPMDKADRFAELAKTVIGTLTPAFAAGLFARTVGLAPVIRDNAAVFAQAAAEQHGSRRMGDTLGAALAGAYSLHSPKRLTLDEARAVLIRRTEVRSAASSADGTPDHDRILSLLLEHVVAVQVAGGVRYDRSIAELAAAVIIGVDPIATVPAVAGASLQRMGVRVDPGEDAMIWACQAHEGTSAVFRRSPWAGSWSTTLLQMPGARRSGKNMRFGHLSRRAVGIPIAVAFPEGFDAVVRERSDAAD